MLGTHLELGEIDRSKSKQKNTIFCIVRLFGKNLLQTKCNVPNIIFKLEIY